MSLRHAILGFLAEGPLTGYDLRKIMDQSVGYFWSADQAQIYRTLTSLVAEGMVSVETLAQTERPNRRLHTIEAAGRAELDRWLSSPLEVAPLRDPFLMRLFHGERSGPAQMRQLLRERVKEAERAVAALEGVRAALELPDTLAARLRKSTLENGLDHAKAERDWALKTLAELEGYHE
jgi:DNA-binding PadR family transcriptional regulator